VGPLRRRLVVGVLVAALTAVAGAAAARLTLDPGTLDVYGFDFVLPAEIAADVDVVPAALQKRSEGLPVTVFVGLPYSYSASNVQVSTVRLCRLDAACIDGGYKPQSVAGGTRLKLVFAREDVIALVDDVPDDTVVTFTVTGLVSSPPATFGGGDQVKILEAPIGS
jgi:hypothetical protein